MQTFIPRIFIFLSTTKSATILDWHCISHKIVTFRAPSSSRESSALGVHKVFFLRRRSVNMVRINKFRVTWRLCAIQENIKGSYTWLFLSFKVNHKTPQTAPSGMWKSVDISWWVQKAVSIVLSRAETLQVHTDAQQTPTQKTKAEECRIKI